MLFFFYYASNQLAPCINKVKQMLSYCFSKCGIKTNSTPTHNDDIPARLLYSSSSNESSCSSSSEMEDDSENEQNVEMRLPIEYGNEPRLSINRSPYLLGFQNRHNRFTT